MPEFDLTQALQFLNKRQLDKAELLLNSCLPQQSSYLESRLYLRHIKDTHCDWSSRDDEVAWLRESFQQNSASHFQPLNFPLCYLPFDISDAEFASYAKCANLYHLKNLAPSNNPPKLSSGELKKKPRVALLSLDLRSHSAGGNLLECFSSALSQAFDLYVYSTAITSVRKTSRGQSSLTRSPKVEITCRFLESLHPWQIAEAISRDEIDLLFDATRHIQDSPSLACEYRPARKQVSAWGYGASTGSSCYDLLLADPYLVKPEEESTYSENIYKLTPYHPDLYSNSDNCSAYRHCGGTNRGATTFAHFGACYKLRPELCESWVEILLEVENSRLILSADNSVAKRNLRTWFEERGIGSDRLQITGRMEKQEFINFLAERVNIYLDNPLLGGSIAYLESLKLGIPSITYDGNCFSGRSAISIAHQTGNSQFVARDQENYRKMAVSLAKAKEASTVKYEAGSASCFMKLICKLL